MDVVFVDFDGVRFHLFTPEKKTVLQLSMNIRCWDELAAYGALDVLQREYGSMIMNTPEPEYNISLQIDLDQLPQNEGEDDILFSEWWLISTYQRIAMHFSSRSLLSSGTWWQHPSSRPSVSRSSWSLAEDRRDS